MEGRTTDLEHRLGAMRLLQAMLLAHLQDNGLIERDLLEAQYWRTLEQSGACEHAHADMLTVFEQATLMVDHWSAGRRSELGATSGSSCG